METVLTLSFENYKIVNVLLGERDKHLQILEKIYDIEILPKGTTLQLRGSKRKCEEASLCLNQLYLIVENGLPICSQDIVAATNILRESPNVSLREVMLDFATSSPGKTPVGPKTLTQRKYIAAIRSNDFVFGWGPAGTGKTYIAMAMAVSALSKKEVDRIILTRPAVEAGERLGFLPGNLIEKVDPYLRPLYDALHDMIDHTKAQEYLQNGKIEVAPLAFMRGRTLSRSFVILDEAQNSTAEQMKMFLTRVGYDSKVVVTGDITQIDLPANRTSGLTEALTILRPIEGIAFIEFSERDVVRHPLIKKIIAAYENNSRVRPSE